MGCGERNGSLGLRTAMGVEVGDGRAARATAPCLLRAGMLVQLVLADDAFSSADVSVLFGQEDVEETLSIGCHPDGKWGAPASTLLYDLPNAGTSAECLDIPGTRSVCSTPNLGANGCELLANTAGCTCHAFCEHHGLVCEASWDDNYKMCIRRTDDQLCTAGSAEQICLCVAHEKPPVISIAELVAIIGTSAIILTLLAIWFYCHGKVPECELWSTKRDETEVRRCIDLTYGCALCCNTCPVSA